MQVQLMVKNQAPAWRPFCICAAIVLSGIQSEVARGAEPLSSPRHVPIWKLHYGRTGRLLAFSLSKDYKTSYISNWTLPISGLKASELSIQWHAEFVDLLPGERVIVLRSYTGLGAYDLYSGRKRNAFPCAVDPMSEVAAGPNGVIAIGTPLGQISIWHPLQNKCCSIQIGARGVTAIGLSADGKCVAVGTDDGRGISIWDVGTGRLREFPVSTERITALTFAPNGTHLAAGSLDGEIFLLDAFKHVVPRKIKIETTLIKAILFSPSGDRMIARAAGSMIHPGSVTLCNALTGERIESNSERLSDCSLPEQSIALSADGQFLAVAGCDNGIDIIDVKSGIVRATKNPTAERPWALSFSPKGDVLAHGGEDGVIHLWNLNLPRNEANKVGYPSK